MLLCESVVFEIFCKIYNSELINMKATQRLRKKEKRSLKRGIEKKNLEAGGVESIASAAIAAATGGGLVDSGVGRGPAAPPPSPARNAT